MWSKSSGEGKGDENAKPSKEQLIVTRFGFLFIAYRVKFWWWEGVELFRKLIMTSILVFVMPYHPFGRRFGWADHDMFDISLVAYCYIIYHYIMLFFFL